MFIKRLIDVDTPQSSVLKKESSQNYSFLRMFCEKKEQAFFPNSLYREAIIDNVTFTQCVLYNSIFTKAQIRDFNVKHSNISSCNFNEAIFGTGVHITWSDVSNATFKNTLMEACNLQHNYFYEADFTGAVLRKSNLSRCNLARANFTGTNLRETNLCGANLSNIRYNKDTSFWEVIYNIDTVFPRNFDMSRLGVQNLKDY